MIELIGINKSYETKNHTFDVLKNINLKLDERMCHGIVGYSGAGKSTLVRLINGLIKPSSGKILIDQVDLFNQDKKTINALRHQIGFVFQSHNLLSQLTVYDNVLLSLKISKYPKKLRHSRVMEVLDRVGLQTKAFSYPKTLSGGQQQRVGIARAIATKPKYLLCDEITSALDVTTALEVVKVLNDIQAQEQITIVFISHQMDIILAIADQVIVMKDGQIEEIQETKRLFIDPLSETSKMLLKQGQLDDFRADHTYQLMYDSNCVYEMVLSTMIKRYMVDLSIFYAQTISIKKEIIGIMIIKLKGAFLADALSFLESHQIRVIPFNKEMS